MDKFNVNNSTTLIKNMWCNLNNYSWEELHDFTDLKLSTWWVMQTVAVKQDSTSTVGIPTVKVESYLKVAISSAWFWADTKCAKKTRLFKDYLAKDFPSGFMSLFFSSRCILELKFAICHRAAYSQASSVTVSAVMVDESLTQASV